MYQLELVSALKKAVAHEKQIGNKIGLVPTMGALHEGHLSLVAAAQQKADIVVVSIFVNPTQFNESDDYQLYPRTIEEDLALLKKANVDYVFIPEVSEIYPSSGTDETFNFGSLEKEMEGAHRPGHFNGVAMVVKRLFEIVEPHTAFFGEKDFQQLAIIKALTNKFELDIDVVGCPIYREQNGLAMSSRNERLSALHKDEAKLLFEMLSWGKNNAHKFSPSTLTKKIKQALDNNPHITIEYVTVADTHSLQELAEWQQGISTGIFAAIRIGEVRLIDNIILI
ncbi:MAG: pantoate--beta-alanine ligase [Flavobacteriales bacterium]